MQERRLKASIKMQLSFCTRYGLTQDNQTLMILALIDTTIKEEIEYKIDKNLKIKGNIKQLNYFFFFSFFLSYFVLMLF